MKKVLLTAPLSQRGRLTREGVVVELDDAQAEVLLACGNAIEVPLPVEAPAPGHKRGRARVETATPKTKVERS